jgi:hypothetical protein
VIDSVLSVALEALPLTHAKEGFLKTEGFLGISADTTIKVIGLDKYLAQLTN